MRPLLRCLSGHGPRAISGHISGLAGQRSAGAPCAQRCGAGARRGDHRSAGACANSIAAGLVSAASCRRRDRPMRRSTNSELFALPSMVPVRKALDAEFDRYIARHKASLPNETIGVGTAFDFQLFDRALLDSPNTRFVLAGIVNRMDRAYVHEAELRRNPADLPPDPNRCAGDDGRGRGLAAAADDAERGAEGQRRFRDRRRRQGACLRRDRPPLARRRRIVADRCRAGGKTDREGRPAGSDTA